MSTLDDQCLAINILILIIVIPILINLFFKTRNLRIKNQNQVKTIMPLVSLLVGSIICVLGYIGISTFVRDSLKNMAECYSNYIVKAWMDSNSDGNRSNDELPLQNVYFESNFNIPDPPYNLFVATSDKDGIAELSGMVNGMWKYGEMMKITAKPPLGFTNTTPTDVTVEICSSGTVQFGFFINLK